MKKKDLKTNAYLDEADAIFDGQIKIDILATYQKTQFYKRFYDDAKKQTFTHPIISGKSSITMRPNSPGTLWRQWWGVDC